MGKGIDLARPGAPEHAEILDNFKDQLLIVLVKRLGGSITIPISEVDDTGSDILSMSLDTEDGFYFEVSKKS